MNQKSEIHYFYRVRNNLGTGAGYSETYGALRTKF